MSGLILRESTGILTHTHTMLFCQHSEADGNDPAEQKPNNHNC